MSLNPSSQRINSTKSASSRRQWLQTTALVGAVALGGCLSEDGDGGDGDNDSNGGSVGDTDEEVVIEYWRWPHSTDPSNEAENQIVEDFNNLDNGIRVEQDRTPFGDFPTRLKSAVGAGDAPDVAWNLWPGELYDPAGKSREDIMENAPYQPLDDVLDEEFMDQFWDGLWVSQLNQQKVIGQVPFVAGFSPGFLYVNADAWDEAGLGEMPEDSWGFDEFHNALETISNNTDLNGLGVGFKDILSQDRWQIVEEKSRFFDKVIGEGFLNEDDEYSFTMADDAMQDGWENYYGIPIENGWTADPMAYTNHEMVEQFFEGVDAIMTSHTWARAGIAENADFEWDILPFPTVDGQDTWIREGSSAGMSIFKEDIGGNIEAAKEFVQFRNNAENHFKFFNISSQAVPNREAYELLEENELSDFVKESRGEEVMHGVGDAFEELLEVAHNQKEQYPSIKSSEVDGATVVNQGLPNAAGQTQQIAGEEIQRMLDGEDPEEALVNMEDRWTDAFDMEGHQVNQDSVGFNQPEPGN